VAAAVAIADVAEEHSPQWPHQIGDGEATECRQQRDAALAEEHAAEDGDEIEVEGEIVPFDDRRKSGDRQRAARQGGRGRGHLIQNRHRGAS
jgi:hypothetical protein